MIEFRPADYPGLKRGDLVKIDYRHGKIVKVLINGKPIRAQRI